MSSPHDMLYCPPFPLEYKDNGPGIQVYQGSERNQSSETIQDLWKILSLFCPLCADSREKRSAG
jgi:hypothetical protein